MFTYHQYQFLVLPYLIKDIDQSNKVTYETEVAAVFCLALLHRKKTRIIFGKLESLEAISKIYYPLLCVPWMGNCIIIDGLGLSKLIFSDRDIPDLTCFLESLKKSRATLNSFIETIDAGAKVFSNLLEKKKEEREISCLIGNIKLVNVLAEKLRGNENFIEDKNSIIPARITKSDCKEIVENVSREWRRLKIEASMLKYTLRILNEEVNHHMEKLSRESEQIWQEYRRRLANLEKEVSKRIKQMTREKEREIKKILNSYKKRINSLRREREKLEKTIHKMKQTLEKNLKRKTRSNERIKFYEEKIDELAKSIRSLVKLEEKSRKEKDREIKEIEEKYDVLITNEKEKFKVLKESRDVELSRVNEKSEKIRRIHSVITKQIEQLIKEKETLVKMIEECTLSMKIDEPVIIGVPLYAVKYRRNSSKIRFNFYPPARIPDPAKTFKGDRGKFMRLNLRDRITMFLSPLSQDLNNTILGNLNEAIRTDLHLNEKIRRIIDNRNLLGKSNFMKILETGLKNLRANGWIKSQEIDSILNSLRS